MPSCLIADDQPLVRDALASLLDDHDMSIVSTATTGDNALKMLRKYRPDVAIIDLPEPRLAGLDFLTAATRCAPRTRLLVYAGCVEPELARHVLQHGATGYVAKSSPLKTLMAGAESVARRVEFVDPAIIHRQQERGRRVLTRREFDVLLLLCEGMSTGSIADRIGIARPTARHEVSSILLKLGATSRLAAILTALRMQMV